jgi:hypothetical protein
MSLHPTNPQRSTVRRYFHARERRCDPLPSHQSECWQAVVPTSYAVAIRMSTAPLDALARSRPSPGPSIDTSNCARSPPPSRARFRLTRFLAPHDICAHVMCDIPLGRVRMTCRECDDSAMSLTMIPRSMARERRSSRGRNRDATHGG